MDLTVAIDGPAAAGKGTLAKRLAAHFNLPHLDTGLLYRAVARQVLAGQDPEVAARALSPEDLQPEGLYTSQVAQQASKVAALGPVREALINFQRSFAGQAGGAVLDGRDIGTVICPAAQVKLYVTARPEVRAERRHRELISNGAEVTLAQVLRDVNERDARDQDRAEAPLRAAWDAIEIDTSDLSIDAALERAIVAVAQNRQPQRPL
jgi:cytidylate kinase